MISRGLPGSSIDRSSRLYAVDARVKLVCLLLVTAALFMSSDLAVVCLFLPLLAVAMKASGVRASQALAAAKPVAFLLAFTLLSQLVCCGCRPGVSAMGPVGLNPAGGLRGLVAVVRILALLGFALCVAASTTPQQLSDGCMRLLAPLGRLGVPVAQVSSVVSISLRFIPLVVDEFQKIQFAQRARGVRFDSGSVFARIRRYASVMTPLIVALLRRSDKLSESMAARCYDDGANARVAPLALSVSDRVLLALALSLFVLFAAAHALM